MVRVRMDAKDVQGIVHHVLVVPAAVEVVLVDVLVVLVALDAETIVKEVVELVVQQLVVQVVPLLVQ